MSDEMESAPLGAGHMAAMGRMGLKELSQALPAFPSAGIQPVEEVGAVANPTPQEVMQGKESGIESMSYESMLGSRAAAVEPEPEQELER